MEQPPAKKRRLLEMGDDIEPMEVDPPGSDTEPMEWIHLHRSSPVITRLLPGRSEGDHAPHFIAGAPGSVHLSRDGRLGAGADPPVLQDSYEPFLPVPLPRPFPSPLISSSPSPEEEGRAGTAILRAAVPGQRDEYSRGTANIAGHEDPVSLPSAMRAQLRAIPQVHTEPPVPDHPSLDSQGSREPILPVPLPHPCPGREEKPKGQRQLLLGRTRLWFRQEEVLNCSKKVRSRCFVWTVLSRLDNQQFKTTIQNNKNSKTAKQNKHIFFFQKVKQ
ncbi:uncharacterized protein LOC110393469 [Numida meleagris]|uniref:uncharacterized protein LOC110393469 n=1 Tax=Numida meleagris TaxID=8996 RepID=UPI000B3E4010|nr:uncharacterized protein LOC110393469 [Numida meleagris]